MSKACKASTTALTRTTMYNVNFIHVVTQEREFHQFVPSYS